MEPTLLSKDEAIRERVLTAARQLFQQHGLYKVTMEDIARALGKGKSSLYYYYKSRKDILLAVLDRDMHETLTSVAEAVAQATTAEDKLYAFYSTRLRLLRQKVALHTVVAGEVLRDVEFTHFIKQRYRQREGNLLRQILTFGRPVSLGEAALDALVLAVLSGVHGLEHELLFAEDLAPVEPAIRILSRGIILGLDA